VLCASSGFLVRHKGRLVKERYFKGLFRTMGPHRSFVKRCKKFYLTEYKSHSILCVYVTADEAVLTEARVRYRC